MHAHARTHKRTRTHTQIIYCEVSRFKSWQRQQNGTQFSSSDSVRQHAREDLLCQARNVISCVSINSARVVKLFQAFVAPTVIPANRAQVKRWPLQEETTTAPLTSNCCWFCWLVTPKLFRLHWDLVKIWVSLFFFFIIIINVFHLFRKQKYVLWWLGKISIVGELSLNVFKH